MKSKARVREYGEVYTPEPIVNAMLDLVQHETERIDSRFLEPACGNGNFLAEVLRRKLHTVTRRYAPSQLEWELYALLALSSLYGVDILEDNCRECRTRLFDIFNERYAALFHNECKEACRRSAKFLLERNIIWGDALDYTNPQTKEPIIFSEWSVVNQWFIQRRDFAFRFLVEKRHQTSLFSDAGDPVAIDEPIRDYPPKHFLKLGDDERDTL